MARAHAGMRAADPVLVELDRSLARYPEVADVEALLLQFLSHPEQVVIVHNRSVIVSERCSE